MSQPRAAETLCASHRASDRSDFQLARRCDHAHEVKRSAQPAQRDTELMNAFGIAAIPGRGERLEKMLETGTQDDGKRVVESDRCVEAKLAWPSRSRRHVIHEVEAACGFAADRRAERPMLREPQRKVVDCGRAAALQLQLDFAHGERAVAGFQNALVECDLDGAGRQLDDTLVPSDVADEDRLERLPREIGAKLGRNKGHRQRDVGRE